jgi:P-type Cu2+ transporter
MPALSCERRARQLDLAVAAGVREIAGAGLCATIDTMAIRLGSAAHCGVPAAEGTSQSLWYREGQAAPIVFMLEDILRPDATWVVSALFKAGYAVEILSGDRAAAVAEAAAATGITQWRAAQRPGDKIHRLEELERAGHKVLMVGDGLNDAPALAAGHASISPASAADISQTAADAVFQDEALAPIVETLVVAKAGRRRALENFIIAIGYNLVFVPLAVAGRVTPLIAAIAMSASSLAVTANALRLAHRKKGTEK